MLICKNVHIRHKNFEIKNINFTIKTGDYAMLMGQTGCGKTSILEAICGLKKMYSGRIYINHKIVNAYPAAARSIGYVPQNADLFTHMSVFENIGFALKIRKVPAQKIKTQVHNLAQQMEIAHLLQRKTTTGLSGGEKQRIALARALIFEPKILCMDEPLSSLDEQTKKHMYELLKSLKKKLDLAVLHISHSTQEAQILADTILSIEQGTLKLIKP